LRMRVRRQGAEQQSGENPKVPHTLEVLAGYMRAPSRIREGRITKVPSARDKDRMSAGAW
jgi:hypothetical protein